MFRKAALIGCLLAVITIQPSAQEPLPPKVKPVAVEPKHDTKEQRKANKKLAKAIAGAGFGWTGKEWKCLDYILYNESKYDRKADNKHSTAYGLAQMLGEDSKDAAIQLLHGYKYIVTRYDTPCKAVHFHHRHRYY